MRYCTECGAPNDDDNRFCQSCRAKLEPLEQEASFSVPSFGGSSEMTRGAQLKAKFLGRELAKGESPKERSSAANPFDDKLTVLKRSGQSRTSGSGRASAPCEIETSSNDDNAKVSARRNCSSISSFTEKSAESSRDDMETCVKRTGSGRSAYSVPYTESFVKAAAGKHADVEDIDRDALDDAMDTVIGKRRRSYRLDRPGTGESFAVSLPCLIGRGSAADCRIRNNPKISREQSRIQEKGGVCFICDLDSVNGTYVNGVLLSGQEEKSLSDGDEVLLGEEVFIFRVE